MGLRITTGIARAAPVRFRFDGVEIEGIAGESVAVALLAAGIRALRTAPGDGGPRGMFCAMGACQECVVLIDDHLAEACRVPVRAGLDVRRQTPP
ncbi:(2Fe-2S)-binding protein [Humitalea sp. 24SJ18S-53]|uniref:(2Fe-2S)-binding protein n=1 Tax=Humitalea sp. 24SJ18S-53 TaxID=3422307 RepID=UPI003D67BC72